MMAANGQDHLREARERRRQRQTFKFAAELLQHVTINENGQPKTDGSVRTAHDTIFTALAQLAVVQTGTSRAMISVFDLDYQYILAEATSGTTLLADHSQPDLWLCGSALHRRQSVCESTMLTGDEVQARSRKEKAAAQLPVTIIPDLRADAKAASKPIAQMDDARFYAAVPICTPKGINIGSLCVFHPEAPPTWSTERAQILQNISHSVMHHLDSNLARQAHRRSERMNRGIGSFMEDQGTMAGWKTGPYAAAFLNQPDTEGSLNARQQEKQQSELPQSDSDATLEEDVVHVEDPKPGSDSGVKTSISRPHPYRIKSQAMFRRNDSAGDMSPSQEPARPEETRQEILNRIFSKAANIIREAVEVEGCIFLDAAIGGLDTRRGLSSRQSDSGRSLDSSDLSSGNEVNTGSDGPTPARILGFSTSNKSSVNDEVGLRDQFRVAEKLLAALLRRYPKGMIFNFAANGELESSQSSEEDQLQGLFSPVDDTGPTLEDQPAARKKKSIKPWARKHDAKNLLEAFPGARSIVFVPVWDSRRDRWYAGGLAYTQHPHRIFTSVGELSYLRAFGVLAMAETLQQEFLMDDQAKQDALSSMSHELRSPLHGIILGVELLNETSLTVLQGDILHSLETCGRTLSDTLNHLLDYSKINSMSRKDTQHRTSLRENHMADPSEGETAHVKLDMLVEEVMESVFAGFNFQRKSIAQMGRLDNPGGADAVANQRLDSMRAQDDLGPNDRNEDASRSLFEDVMVVFSADPSLSWSFETEPGAFRRILMNIFGNSLKHTQKGLIKVSIEQGACITTKERKKQQLVSLIVSDTGRGMSEDFLRNQLYKPFSQENPLAPGTGLGLSLVKRITSQLNGRISVDSRQGIGTTIKVTLPLTVPTRPLSGNPAGIDEAFDKNRNELRGLRVQLLGLDRESSQRDENVRQGCAAIESICRDWLELEVISGTDPNPPLPDVFLASEDQLGAVEEESKTARVPCVVVCANALIAHQRSRSSGKPTVVKYVSQPLGPHKLAKILLLVFRKWTDLQDAPSTAEPESSDALSPFTPLESGTSNDESEYIPADKSEAASPASANTQKPTLQVPSSKPDHFMRPPHAGLRPGLSRTTSSYMDMSSVQFLLVDDNAINLRMLIASMEKLGYKSLHTAVNGQEAVDKYKNNPAACRYIFTDISMPVMDGFESTKQMRAFEAASGVRPPATIVAVTALASEEARKSARTCGIDLFLTKPVRLKELRNVLTEMGVPQPKEKT